jgi:hypothetical protein
VTRYGLHGQASRPPLWSSGQEFLATDPEVPGSIPGATKFAEKYGSGTGPLLVNITEEFLEWKISGFVSRKLRLTSVGIHSVHHATPCIRKSWHELRRQAAGVGSV